ncbi:Transcription factor [Sporothrix stenoceras]
MTDAPPVANAAQVAGSKRKRSNILDLISDLEHRLPLIKSDNVAAAALADTVRRRTLQKDHSQLDDDGDAHKAGVLLWNLVLRLERDVEKIASNTTPAEYRRLLLHSRVLAFVIIDRSICPEVSSTNAGEDQSAVSQMLYLLGIALRAAKACIDGEDTELGHLVLEKAATYRQTMTRLFIGDKDENTERQKTKADQLGNSYLALQLTQLWRENELSDANKLYTDYESSNPRDTLNTESLESMISALFQIGKSLLCRKEFAAAVTWLDRARESLSTMDQAALSSDMKELHLSITHSLAIACLGLQTPAGNQRAEELAQCLRTTITEDNDRRVQLIQLELYASPLSESFDASGYADVLLQMITTFKSSPEEFKLLHHHIQKLHNKSPGLGCKVLDEFMLSLRHRDDAIEWIEKLIITRVWLLAHQRETKEELDAVQSVLSKLRIPIGADTASAAQTNGDVDAAKAVYVRMPWSSRDEPMTKYYLFKLSIKADDQDMATDCLRGITISADKMKLLHACVLHARHENAPQFMVQAMKSLADAINHDPSSQVHAPALFRCTILMLRDMIDEAIKDGDSLTEGSSAKKQQATQDLADIFGGGH